MVNTMVPDALSPVGRRVLCGLCGSEFAEDLGQPACRSCPLGGSCHFIRCPQCGYENPAVPGWLAKLRRSRKRTWRSAAMQQGG